jgi:hypothetical protein
MFGAAKLICSWLEPGDYNLKRHGQGYILDDSKSIRHGSMQGNNQGHAGRLNSFATFNALQQVHGPNQANTAVAKSYQALSDYKQRLAKPACISV